MSGFVEVRVLIYGLRVHVLVGYMFSHVYYATNVLLVDNTAEESPGAKNAAFAHFYSFVLLVEETICSII